MIVILFPMSWISSVASAFHEPPVSIATGMKMWVLVMPIYFVFLAMAALSATAPVCKRYYQGGTVHTYLLQLYPKPLVCHGPKVSTLHHLDVWRLYVTEPLAPWKLVPEPSFLLFIVCR